SLANRLALVFFAITLLAIGSLYVYVAPGLQSRLMGEKLGELAQAARHDSRAIAATVGSSTALPQVREIVIRTGGISGDRITLLSVNMAQGGRQLSVQAASSNLAAAGWLTYPVARDPPAPGSLSPGTEPPENGIVAEAAEPIRFLGRDAAVIVYSAPVSDI